MVELALYLGAGRDQENRQVRARSSLHCHEWTFQGVSGASSETEEEGYRESLSCSENSDPEQKGGGLQMAKDGVSDRNENMFLETGRQAMFVIKWQKTLAELCSCSRVCGR